MSTKNHIINYRKVSCRKKVLDILLPEVQKHLKCEGIQQQVATWTQRFKTPLLSFFFSVQIYIVHILRNITQQKVCGSKMPVSSPTPPGFAHQFPPRVMWPLALLQISWRRGTQHTQWGPFTSSGGLALSSKQRSQHSRRSLYFSSSLKCFSPSLCSSLSNPLTPPPTLMIA